MPLDVSDCGLTIASPPVFVYLDSLNHLGHLHLGLSLHRFAIHPCDFITSCQCPIHSCWGVVKDLPDSRDQIKKVLMTLISIAYDKAKTFFP